jgi:nucleoid-associated protein YgaU
VSRLKKIVIVVFVLALGVGLAWPYRKSATRYAPDPPTVMPSKAAGGSVTVEKRPGKLPLRAVDSTSVRGKPLAAKMASTGDNGPTTPFQKGFDLENHAVLVGQPISAQTPATARQHQSPVTSEAQNEDTRASRPAYSSSRVPSDEAAWPEELIHIVRNGDTLEKLAERYLGDADRALELFDLNRDQLANPHLLPIDAELRIPVPHRRESD